MRGEGDPVCTYVYKEKGEPFAPVNERAGQRARLQIAY